MGLGIDPRAEEVYRRMLFHPEDGVKELATELELSEEEVRRALDLLSELAMVRASAGSRARLHAINPQLGTRVLLSHQQTEILRRQQELEVSRAAATKLITDYNEVGGIVSEDADLTVIRGLDEIRDNLHLLNEQVAEEFLTFAPGGAQTSENIRAARPLNKRLLQRGVRMRTVYLDSLTNDTDSIAHARDLIDLGAQVRTTATLPTRMIIFDRATALVALDNEDTAKGAVVIRSPGVLAALCTLFESVWAAARELAPSPGRSEEAGEELPPQQIEVLRMLGEGHTDEVIARRLGVSPRTARRIASEVMARLSAKSRFQAGVNAVRFGHLSSN